jgi:hypothetical protein
MMGGIIARAQNATAILTDVSLKYSLSPERLVEGI